MALDSGLPAAHRAAMLVTEVRGIVLDEDALTIPEIVEIARGARVSLGPAATERIRESRAVVDRLVNGERLIYGLNTGLGHMRNERVPLDILEATQIVTVRVHSGGIGPPLPPEIVRAAIAVRLAGIARGGSGASPAIADAYVAMLNARRASDRAGDRVGRRVRPDAHGRHRAGRDRRGRGGLRGRTYVRGRGASPRRHRPDPAWRQRTVSRSSRRTACRSGMRRWWSIVRAGWRTPRTSSSRCRSKPRRRISRSSRRWSLRQNPSTGRRSLRVASTRSSTEAGSAPTMRRRSRTPLSFRVAPQVLGAFREVVDFAADAVEGELAAMDDNPLVSIRRRSHDQQRQLPSDPDGARDRCRAAGARACRPAVGPTDGPAVGPSGIRPGGVHTRGLRAAEPLWIAAPALERSRAVGGAARRWPTRRRSTSGRLTWVSRTTRRTRRWPSGEPMRRLVWPRTSSPSSC